MYARKMIRKAVAGTARSSSDVNGHGRRRPNMATELLQMIHLVDVDCGSLAGSLVEVR